MPKSWDSILSDEPSVHTLPDGPEGDPSSETASEPEAQPTEADEAPEAESKASAKPKVETAKGDEHDDEDPDPSDFSAPGLRKALTAERKLKKDERKKRQEYERKLAQLEGQIQALTQHGARPQSAPPKPSEDPESAFYGNPVAFVEARLAKAAEEAEAKEFRKRADRSERRMLREHDDYNEAKAAFQSAAQKAPWLWQQVTADEDLEPAEVVYREGKRLLGGGNGGSGNAAYEERIKALEAEIAEARSGAGGAKTPVKPIPKSIAAARGSGASAKPARSGTRSMEEILG